MTTKADDALQMRLGRLAQSLLRNLQEVQQIGGDVGSQCQQLTLDALNEAIGYAHEPRYGRQPRPQYPPHAKKQKQTSE